MAPVTSEFAARDGIGFTGLLAMWLAEQDAVNDAELKFYRRAIEQNGEPALDLACGTGRILRRLVKHGLEVHGCDSSVEMIGYCMEQAEREGIIPTTFVQAVHQLSLPQKYCTIMMCDSFGLNGSRDQEMECLRRIVWHLAPGGIFVFNHSIPSGDEDVWRYWLPQHQKYLPQPWPTMPQRQSMANGEVLEMRSRIERVDLSDQQVVRAVRIALTVDGKTQREEEHFITENYYFRRELETLLKQAGFDSVTLREGYSAEPASFDTFKFGVIARVPWESERATG